MKSYKNNIDNKPIILLVEIRLYRRKTNFIKSDELGLYI